MKLSLFPSMLLALIGLVVVNATPLLGADSTSTDTKVKKTPFHGKLAAVDQSAQTITVGKTARVFHVTPTTKITDGSGNPSTLASAVVGEDVGGSYTKDAAGTLTLFSVRLGAKDGSKPTAAASTPAATPAPKPAAKPAPAPAAAPAATAASTPAASTTEAKAKKQTFSGKVVSVDAASNTVVIHGKADQTFTTTPTTKFTGVAGLAELTVGAKVTGSYSKSADGSTLTVYTLKTK